MDTKLKKSKEINDKVLLSELPSNSTLQLFHANTRMKEEQIELIVKQIDLQKQNNHRIDIKANKRELERQFWASNNTISENKSSANRFKQKTQDLLSAQALLQYEIDQTEMEIEKYSKIEKIMEKYTTMYSKLFTSYLETVAHNFTEFNSTQDILNKYEMLKKCRTECAQLLDKEINGALGLKEEMTKTFEENSSRLKLLDNSLVMLRIREERAADKRTEWNQVVIRLKQVIANRLEDSVTLREGCYDLYRDTCNKRKIKPVVKKEDIKSQMQYIANTILFYKDVLYLATDLQQNRKQKV